MEKEKKKRIINPEMETIRKKKISDAVKKRYENGFKNTPLSEEAKEKRKKIMSEKMIKYYATRTEEQKKKSVSAANKANKGAKRSDESKEKMSKSYKKYKEENIKEFNERYIKAKETRNKRTKEQKETIKIKQSESIIESWVEFKKDKKKFDKRSKKLSDFMKSEKNPMKNVETAKKLSEILTGRELSNEHKMAIANANTSGGTVKSKWYDVEGIKCQGNSEKIFVEKCIKEGKKVISHPMSYKTPFGFYRPDFIIDGQLVEIKSSWTYKQFLLKNQFKTLGWVNNNINKIDIWIVDSVDKIERIICDFTIADNSVSFQG